MFSLVRTFRLSPTRYVNPRQTNYFPFRRQPFVSNRSSLLSTLFHPIRTFTSTTPTSKSDQIDWNNLDKHSVEDLPDFVSEEKLLEDKKFWDDFENSLKDSDQDPNNFISDDEINKDLDISFDKFKEYPLPTTIPDISNNRQAQLLLARCTEEIRLYVKYSKFDDVVKAFLEVRMNHLIPTLEMYEHVIPILGLWNDGQTINLLIEEMDSLGYRKGEKIYYTTLTQAMVADDKPEVDKIWQEIKNRKFEVTPHIYKLVLGYLTKRNDLEEVVSWYRMMRKLGVIVDGNPASILLEMCRINKFYDFANEVITDTENDGILLLDDEKDLRIYKFEDGEYKDYPKKLSIIETCLIIAEIFANQRNLEKCEEYYTKAKIMFQRNKTTTDTFKPHTRLYESIIEIYNHFKLWDKARDLLQEMLDEGSLPSLEFWRKAFLCFLRNDKSQLFLRFAHKFESLGLEFEDTIYSEQVAMWYRIGDYRRAKNAYSTIIQNGSIPTIEARMAIIQVYAAVGFPGDVQKFYDEQLRTGRPMTPIMHNVMILDCLKRGEPELTLPILQRMKNEGHPADISTFVKVLRACGIEKINKLIAEFIFGPKPIYSMNGDILAALINKSTNLESAFEYWEKLGSLVKLDAVTGKELLQIFGKFSTKTFKNVAMEVYEKTKKECNFTPSDSAFFETAIMSCSNISQIHKIVEDLKQYGIKKSRPLYRTILAKYSELHHPREALSLVLEYLKENQENGLIYSDVIFSFFEVMINNDNGEYREDALKWTQMLLQSNMESLTAPIQNEEMKGLLEPNQILAIVKYIHSMSPDLIIPSWIYPMEEGLFQPSLTDIEDILVHQYGYGRKEVKAVLGDPSLVEALSVFKKREKEILEEVQKEKLAVHENVEKKVEGLPKISDLHLWNEMMKTSMEKIFFRLREKKLSERGTETDIIQVLKKSFR